MNPTGYMPGIMQAAKARRASGLHAYLAAKPIESDPVPAPPEFERIVRVVCKYVGVQQWVVYDNGRHCRTTAARQLIVVLARKLTLMSYPEIARAMCRRSHSSFVDMASDWQKRVENNVKVNTSRGDIEPLVVLERITELLKERTEAA